MGASTPLSTRCAVKSTSASTVCPMTRPCLFRMLVSEPTRTRGRGPIPVLMALLIRLWTAFKDRSRQMADGGRDSFAVDRSPIRPPSGGGG